MQYHVTIVCMLYLYKTLLLDIRILILCIHSPYHMIADKCLAPTKDLTVLTAASKALLGIHKPACLFRHGSFEEEN